MSHQKLTDARVAALRKAHAELCRLALVVALPDKIHAHIVDYGMLADSYNAEVGIKLWLERRYAVLDGEALDALNAYRKCCGEWWNFLCAERKPDVHGN